jgi:hypothetical protein
VAVLEINGEMLEERNELVEEEAYWVSVWLDIPFEFR